jgi:hypothetical protein
MRTFEGERRSWKTVADEAPIPLCKCIVRYYPAYHVSVNCTYTRSLPSPQPSPVRERSFSLSFLRACFSMAPLSREGEGLGVRACGVAEPEWRFARFSVVAGDYRVFPWVLPWQNVPRGYTANLTYLPRLRPRSRISRPAASCATCEESLPEWNHDRLVRIAHRLVRRDRSGRPGRRPNRLTTLPPRDLPTSIHSLPEPSPAVRGTGRMAASGPSRLNTGR